MGVDKALQEAQLQANPRLKEHQTLSTKTKNLTRWLGLWEMCNRNRRIGVEIRVALTGDSDGTCTEAPARPARPATTDDASDSSDSDGDSGDDLEEGCRAANKQYPLAHRCLSAGDFKSTEILESLLDRPREVTTVCQDSPKGFGEGIDLGLNHLIITDMRDEALADRVEIVSGRVDTEVWKEVNASSLAPMFKTFRKEFAAQLTKRFNLDSTPTKHVLLALKMNPSLATGPDSPQMVGKTAKFELMEGEYQRALRRQAIRVHRGVAAAPEAPAQTPAPVPVPVPARAPAPAPTTAPTTATPRAASPTNPPGKRRKGLLGAVAAQQSGGPTGNIGPDAERSKIDMVVKAEVDNFEMISMKTLAQVHCALPACTAHWAPIHAVPLCPRPLPPHPTGSGK